MQNKVHFLVTPLLAHHQVNLINDPIIAANNWRRLTPDNLTMTWPAFNISMNPNASVDITLWGYWEDVLNYTFEEVALNTPRCLNYSTP